MNNNIKDDKTIDDANNNANNNINANSNSVDDFDGDDSYAVRVPDPVKTEQLIGTFEQNKNPLVHQYYNHYQNFNDQNFNDQNFNDQVKKAIEISKNEFDIFQDEEDKKNIELIEKEKEKERIAQFQTIRQKLNRMLVLDKVNTRLYENIFTIITLYESGYVTKYNTSEAEVTAFFKLFNSIRLTNEELMSLKQLFIEDI